MKSMGEVLFEIFSRFPESDVLILEESGERYLKETKLKDILEDDVINRSYKVELPEAISEFMFLAEESEWDLLEALTLLIEEGASTERGTWLQVEGNIDKLIQGWFYGYIIEASREVPSEVKDELLQLKEEGSKLFEIIRYKDVFSSEVGSWIVQGGSREDSDYRISKIVELWNTI